MNYELWMILLELDNAKKIQIIKEYKNCKTVYDKFEDIIKNDEEIFEKLKFFQKDDLVNEILRVNSILKKENISYITYDNPLYREVLDKILDPPFFLFYKGNIDVIKSKSIAVVGARKCSNYGLIATKVLTKELITNNITLISGGARGADSAAHKTALELNGKNICVLGCGIDIAYPKENKRMFSKICENGVVISEFLLGTQPLRYNFPRRNRIISGLSDCTVVVEASEKSGSLITARYAMSQRKKVIVVPGSIFYNGAAGSNRLIGDECCVCCADVNDFRNYLNFSHIDLKMMNMTPEKQKLIKLINNSPTHIDKIVGNSDINKGKVYALLFEMQMKGEIICLPGNYYVKAL